jgi:hypothetical protein
VDCVGAGNSFRPVRFANDGWSDLMRASLVTPSASIVTAAPSTRSTSPESAGAPICRENVPSGAAQASPTYPVRGEDACPADRDPGEMVVAHRVNGLLVAIDVDSNRPSSRSHQAVHQQAHFHRALPL